MKKLNYLLKVVMALLLFSCEAENPTDDVFYLKKYPQKVIGIKTDNSLLFDNSMGGKDQPSTRQITLIGDSIWKSGSGHSLIYENDEIVVSSNLSRYVFLGSMLHGGSLENMKYTPVSRQTDPITISYSFPADFVIDKIDIPTLGAMRQSIRKVMLNNNMSGTQLASFDYNMSQYSYSDEIKLAFGSNVNVGNILNISANVTTGKIERETGIIAKVVQRNFTVDMDIPSDGNLLLNNTELSSIGDYSPVYVSSITYGRIGIISVQSEYSYKELNVAVKIAFNAGIVNGELNIDANTKKILEESEIKIYIVGGKGGDISQTVEGFHEFKKFITQGGEFTSDAPGVPIYFSVSYLSDNSPYYTKFRVHLAK